MLKDINITDMNTGDKDFRFILKKKKDKYWNQEAVVIVKYGTGKNRLTTKQGRK